MKLFLIWIALVCVLICTSPSGAQSNGLSEPSAILTDRPDQDAGEGTALGERFESLAAGIAFDAPANSRQTRRAVAGDEVVQYVNEQEKWSLRVSRVILPKPVRLTNWTDSSGHERMGMLETAIHEIKTETPGAEILRQDIIDVAGVPTGMIAARTQLGLETRLRQQAILQASEQAYYLFDMSSPAPAPKQGELSEDPAVQRAVSTFTEMVDTARLLDQSAIQRDQEERLFRTRALLVNITPTRLRNALAEQQWLRVIHEGRDIGYSYVVEEIATDLPKRNRKIEATGGQEGVRIGIRSRTLPRPGVQIDAETWYFCTLDKQHEIWRTVGVRDDGKEKDTFGEFGVSDKKTVAVEDPRLKRGEMIRPGVEDPSQPPVRLSQVYTLDVTHFTQKETMPMVSRDLPPFYFPQALGHLLPRLVYFNEGKTYLFASYVSDHREVLKRFVDVGFETEVVLDNQRVRAIPVRDRIGLEGAVTTHYVSPDGKYLGSVNEQAKIQILPTDAQTLEKMWKDADLTRPADVEEERRIGSARE